MALAGKIAHTHNNETKSLTCTESLTFIKHETQKNDRLTGNCQPLNRANQLEPQIHRNYCSAEKLILVPSHEVGGLGYLGWPVINQLSLPACRQSRIQVLAKPAVEELC